MRCRCYYIYLLLAKTNWTSQRGWWWWEAGPTTSASEAKTCIWDGRNHRSDAGAAVAHLWA
jgi:hypothetical protein